MVVVAAEAIETWMVLYPLRPGLFSYISFLPTLYASDSSTSTQFNEATRQNASSAETRMGL